MPFTIGSTVSGLPIPTKMGYTFKGWKTESGQDVNFPFSALSDQTLYASW